MNCRKILIIPVFLILIILFNGFYWYLSKIKATKHSINTKSTKQLVKQDKQTIVGTDNLLNIVSKMEQDISSLKQQNLQLKHKKGVKYETLKNCNW